MQKLPAPAGREFFTLGPSAMQDALVPYRRFVNSHYFYEGVRLTLGIMLPVLLGFYFRQSGWGLAAAMGALAAGITDFPGPIHHRINGIVVVTIAVFGIIVITGSLISQPVWLGLWVAGIGFLGAFATLYGNRASQIGTACLLILTLMLDETRQVSSYAQLAAYTASGGVFYLLLSLTLHGLRPYKLAQQVLGQCMQATAGYLRIKATFYRPAPNFLKLYAQLAAEQVQINAAQQTVREIMFKTRSMVRESTHRSRVLVMAFQELVDLFENVMASAPNYALIQEKLPQNTLLTHFEQMLLTLAQTLEDTGEAFATGKAMPPQVQLTSQLEALSQQFAQARHQLLGPQTIEAFITLRHALDAIEEVTDRLLQLQRYSTYDKNIRIERKVEYQRFIIPSYFDMGQAWANLGWQSNLFRYALRMMVAMSVGYLLSLLLPLGHAYWVLLTIVVILKPGYAITRQRNTDRLLGTAVGVALGALILLTIEPWQVLMAIMLGFMVASFSLWRHRYFLSVATLTVFIIIAMHLLHPANDIVALLKDRLLDTAIGSAIAFVMTLAIPPVWEKLQLRPLAAECLLAARQYLDAVWQMLNEQPLPTNEYKVLRKQTYVTLANLNDAFSRMTNEPKAMQQHAPYWQQLVVNLHVLTGHVGALYTEIKELPASEHQPDFLPICRQLSNRLHTAIAYMGGQPGQPWPQAATGMQQTEIRRTIKTLLLQRQQELQMGQMETQTKNTLSQLKAVLDQLDMMLKLTGDIRRTCRQISQPAHAEAPSPLLL